MNLFSLYVLYQLGLYYSASCTDAVPQAVFIKSHPHAVWTNFLPQWWREENSFPSNEGKKIPSPGVEGRKFLPQCWREENSFPSGGGKKIPSLVVEGRKFLHQ